MFFVLGCGLASLGPGNVSTAALLAPMAMAVAGRAAIPAFLMIIMVGNGAQAGSLSPFAPTGVIVNGLMEKIGLPGQEWRTYWTNPLRTRIVAFGGYFAVRRPEAVPFRARLSRSSRSPRTSGSIRNNLDHASPSLATLLVGVLFFGVNVGMGAFAGAVILAILGAADHKEAVKKMPWSVIVMMSGVTVLIALMEKTGGPRSVYGGAGAAGDAGHHHRRHRVRDRADFGLQQHVGRRAAGIPADHSRADRTAGRRRSAGDCRLDERRCASGRPLAAFHDRRALPRGVCVGREHPQRLQQAARVGTVDDRRRRESSVICFSDQKNHENPDHRDLRARHEKQR